MSKFFEDIVLSTAMVLGFSVGLYLTYALVMTGANYPPTVISTFFALGLGALIYRFMGGLGGTEFAVGLMKLGGSAAFVVAMIWFVGDRLRDEIGLYSSTETYREQIDSLEKQRDNAQSVSDKQENELEALGRKVQNAPGARGVYTISEIRKLKPNDPFVQNLKRLVVGQEPPFSPTLREMLVRVAVVAGSGDQPTFNICRDTLEKLNEGVDVPNTNALFSRSLDDGNTASVTADRSGRIGENVCASEQRDFDVQISCPIALKLFADKITSCAEGAVIRGAKVTIGSLAN